MPRLGSTVLVTLALLALAGCGEEPVREDLGFETETNFAAEIRYCLYGSVSSDQASGCFEHNGLVKQLRTRRITNAVRYAVGDLERCLSDASSACIPHYTDDEVIEDFEKIQDRVP